VSPKTRWNHQLRDGRVGFSGLAEAARRQPFVN
jgi:hypothetical protein